MFAAPILPHGLAGRSSRSAVPSPRQTRSADASVSLSWSIVIDGPGKELRGLHAGPHDQIVPHDKDGRRHSFECDRSEGARSEGKRDASVSRTGSHE